LATASDLAALFEGHYIATEADGRAYLTKTYRRMLDEFSASLARAVAAIAAAQPAGFGCAAGKDRTGLLTALLQELLGVDRTTILAGYVSQAPDAGRLLEALRGWLDCADSDLASPGFSTILSAPKEVLAETLEYLDHRYGGARPYLQTAGLAPGTVQLLRHRLVSTRRPRSNVDPQGISPTHQPGPGGLGSPNRSTVPSVTTSADG
jgi:protein-tyrosine phosphatase